MNAPQTKADLIDQLGQAQRDVAAVVESLTTAQFNSSSEGWSAAGYLKHLLLSVKPFVRAFQFPADQLERRFGLAQRPSMTYAELAAAYDARLAEGIKAEDYDKVLPTEFRMPEGVEDEQAYLLQSWNESNARLLETISGWQEADLDRYQLPHPALGVLTLREMLFFTLHHNTLHGRDIKEAGSSVNA